jgi:hypothetical protein
VLFAYDARDITNEIYNGEQNSGRDRAGIARRFVSPLVVNGRVYVATTGQVDVYGLFSPPGQSGRRKLRSHGRR